MERSRFGSEYIPLVNQDAAKFRLMIPFSKIAWFTVSLPFFGFIFCVAWSVIYNFEHATFTHCKVYNFLPSISAAIGHYKPQKNVWKIAIATQALTRILVLIMYYRYYKEIVYKWAHFISNLVLVTYTIENIALVTLSFWSSNDNYGDSILLGFNSLLGTKKVNSEKRIRYFNFSSIDGNELAFLFIGIDCNDFRTKKSN